MNDAKPQSSRQRYALHPGYIFTVDSKRIDAKRIYVSAVALALHYGLAAGSWIRWDDADRQTYWHRTWGSYIHLYPRPHGDYAAALARAERDATQRQQPRTVHSEGELRRAQADTEDRTGD